MCNIYIYFYVSDRKKKPTRLKKRYIPDMYKI